MTDHRRRLRLAIDGPRGRLEYDGQDITDGVRSVKLHVGEDWPAVAEVQLYVFDGVADLDDADIRLPDKTANALGRLGWHSPGEWEYVLVERDKAIAAARHLRDCLGKTPEVLAAAVAEVTEIVGDDDE